MLDCAWCDYVHKKICLASVITLVQSLQAGLTVVFLSQDEYQLWYIHGISDSLLCYILLHWCTYALENQAQIFQLLMMNLLALCFRESWISGPHFQKIPMPNVLRSSENLGLCTLEMCWVLLWGEGDAWHYAIFVAPSLPSFGLNQSKMQVRSDLIQGSFNLQQYI